MVVTGNAGAVGGPGVLSGDDLPNQDFSLVRGLKILCLVAHRYLSYFFEVKLPLLLIFQNHWCKLCCLRLRKHLLALAVRLMLKLCKYELMVMLLLVVDVETVGCRSSSRLR